MPRVLRVGANDEVYVDPDGLGGGPERRIDSTLTRAYITDAEFDSLFAEPLSQVAAAMRKRNTLYVSSNGRMVVASADDNSLRRVPDAYTGRGAVQSISLSGPIQERVMTSPPSVSSALGASTISGGIEWAWNSGRVGLNGRVVSHPVAPYGAFDMFPLVNPYLPGGVQSAWIHTDSDAVEFKLLEFEGGQVSMQVNDEYVSLTPISLASVFNARFIKLAFSGYSMRKVRVDFRGGLIGGFIVKPDSTVINLQEPRVILLGDSYVGITEGNVASNIKDNLPRQLTRCLGVDNVWPSGTGSRGYLASTGGPNLLNRMDVEVIPFCRPGDLVVNINGFNDIAGTTPSQLGDAVTTFIRKMRAGAPFTDILISTPFHPRPALFGVYDAHDDAVLAACLAEGVDCIDVREMFTGSGFGGSGTGNSSRLIGPDEVHPSAAGNAWIAETVAKKARAKWATRQR